MMSHLPNGVYPDGSWQLAWEDRERVFCRGWRLGDGGNRRAVLFVLPAAINDVIALARREIMKNGVSIETHLSERWLPVHGDRVQLQRVILNLILSAIEAMSTVEAEPRELLISTEQAEASGVLVSVGDSGSGIRPDISRAFSRLFTPRNPAEWGSGCRSVGRSSMPMGATMGRGE